MRVLLLSPLAGLDPPNGDVTYTEQLLAHPPAGVQFVDYASAIEEGSLLTRADRAHLRRSNGLGQLPALAATVGAKGLNSLRKREVLFREPLRFFTVEAGAFDLVHTHVFSCGYRDDWPPIVMSNSVAVEALYRDGLEWSPQSVRRMVRAEKLLARGLRIDHTTYQRARASRLIAFTDDLKRWWVRNGVAAESDIDVVPIAVESREMRPLKERPSVVGFLASAPRIKGLDRALAAHATLRRQGVDAELWIIGSAEDEAPDDIRREPGVRHVGWLPREQLITEVLPQLDVLLHPTRFDGLPLSVLEAMSVGVPVVTSAYRALPDVVGSSGRVVATPEEAATALRELLDPEVNAAAGEAAWLRQRGVFSHEATTPRLLETYRLASGLPTSP